jgi:hypothetical protein
MTKLDTLRHREERSDEAIQRDTGSLSFPGLLRFARKDDVFGCGAR